MPPQADFIVSNGTGNAVRSDINGQLAAIVSNSSGATEPATMYAYQWWADTTTGLLKQRNAANSAWITIGTLASTNLGLATLVSPTFTGVVTVPLGTAALPSLAILSDPNTGFFSPGADQLAISTGGTSRLAVSTTAVSSTLAVDIPLGAVGTPSLTFTGDLNTGLFSPAADTLALVTAGTNRLHITSAGLVGIGTTSPSGLIDAQQSSSGANVAFRFRNTANTAGSTTTIDLSEDGAGRSVWRYSPNTGDTFFGSVDAGNYNLRFYTNANERVRIDNSGRLLVGTSTARSNVQFAGTGFTPATQFETAVAAYDNGLSLINNSTGGHPSNLWIGATKGSAIGSNTLVSNQTLGNINFVGGDGSNLIHGARIHADTDGTTGSGDLPTRLVFSTTADGASSPTERIRISSAGNLFVNKTSTTTTGRGGYITADGEISITNHGAVCGVFRRDTNDGDLIHFSQDGTTEGTISVSGTTVSYNGAHLSRWSQLPGGATREEILRGTVLSNLDEMCGWGDEDNEQLNRMQVSDIEGDKNVSGVFQAWDDDDDTYTDDFYCAMTGDFIIRIAEGITVERGDLLMSAGDGTAKSQGDGYVQDKTIAKVTSTHVTCTYEDGSYCVPCVLMAC